MIGMAVASFKIYKKPSEASLKLKKSNSRAILGTSRPFIPEKN